MSLGVISGGTSDRAPHEPWTENNTILFVENIHTFHTKEVPLHKISIKNEEVEEK